MTRMHGDRICVGGYLEDGAAIRPVCNPAGPREAWLRPIAEGAPITPFSLIEGNVGPAPIAAVPPHTEDRLVPSTGHHVVNTVTDRGLRLWLE